jgi:hypothetical protein
VDAPTKRKKKLLIFLNAFVLRILTDPPLEVHVGEHLFIFYLAFNCTRDSVGSHAHMWAERLISICGEETI